MNKDKSHRANASQFYVAAELCRRGYVAVVTMGNTPNVDILCSNKEANKFVYIQVKTFKSGSKTCSVGLKSEKKYNDNFFWILCGFPDVSQKEDKFEIEYYIIPAKEMSVHVKKNFEIWCKQSKKHNIENKVRTVYLPPHKNLDGWDLRRYQNNWKLIDKKLI